MVVEGRLVISLDFELLWGVRDHVGRDDSYAARILGARAAIPHLLELFAQSNVRATWATVGFLFCEGREDLLANLPALRPEYAESALSSYRYLDELGESEKDDPLSFAPSLIDQIVATPGQEIGTHTLSHYYCLEAGPTLAAFRADVEMAQALARRRGLSLRSIVFPRNQYAGDHLQLCAEVGLRAYRGNPRSWAYRATPNREQGKLRRALRLADAYSGVLGDHLSALPDPAAVLRNVPASRFLRPWSARLRALRSQHLATLRRGMRRAAREGETFHLWWHPHNFGADLEANLHGLRELLACYRELADQYGMQSCAMGDCV